MNIQTEHFLVAGAVLLLVFGFVMSLIAAYTKKHASGAFKRVRKLLPGMNCGQCGCPGCDAYAKALLDGQAKPDACRPGGPDLAEELAQALGLQPVKGDDYDEQIFAPRRVALIHESSCTGCGKCVRVCKVAAIHGVIKQPHEVDPKWCIGCDDCIKACPEGCIEMVREKPVPSQFNWEIKSAQLNIARRQ